MRFSQSIIFIIGINIIALLFGRDIKLYTSQMLIIESYVFKLSVVFLKYPITFTYLIKMSSNRYRLNYVITEIHLIKTINDTHWCYHNSINDTSE